MKLSFYHVDAFSNQAFKGNPAAVFVLDEWLAEETMQAIAEEFNLSETVFSVLEGGRYHIRWFTPDAEVPLCGHATLATSHVLHQHMGFSGDTIQYQSASGPLSTQYENGLYTLDFPSNPPAPMAAPNGLESALGGPYEATLAATEKLLVVLKDEQAVQSLSPNFEALKQLPYRAVCVTAPVSDPTLELDFVCRFFAPAIGINEDPVTGSAYTILTPYYVQQSGKTQFKAKQLSKRGGDIRLESKGERVLISGKAHTVMQGTYFL